MEFPTEENLVSVLISISICGIRANMVLYGISYGRGSGSCMDLQFDLGNSGLYVISYGRGSVFCMDLQLDLGNSTLDLTDPRICMVLYVISYGRGSGFCMDLQFDLGNSTLLKSLLIYIPCPTTCDSPLVC